MKNMNNLALESYAEFGEDRTSFGLTLLRMLCFSLAAICALRGVEYAFSADIFPTLFYFVVLLVTMYTTLKISDANMGRKIVLRRGLSFSCIEKHMPLVIHYLKNIDNDLFDGVFITRSKLASWIEDKQGKPLKSQRDYLYVLEIVRICKIQGKIAQRRKELEILRQYEA